MEFSGTFELEDAEEDTVWLALSDPVMIQHALRGCKFVVPVDDDPDFDALREEHLDERPELTANPDVIERRAFREGQTYAALVQADVGSVNPSFETVVTIDEREQPRMAASGEGSAGNSSFEMESAMELSETDQGVVVDWSAEADVFGRLAQMGQRMIAPVANRMAKEFFRNIQEQLEALGIGEETAEATAQSGGGGPAEGSSADGADDAPTRTADDAPSEGAGEPPGERDDEDSPTGSADDVDEGSRTNSTDPDGEAEGHGGIVARLKRLVGLG